jgi:hypothetical protein
MDDRSILPDLDAPSVLEGQGIDSERASPALTAVAEGVIEEARSLVAPASSRVVRKVLDFHHQTVVLDSGGVFEGPLAARALAGSKEVAMVVCSLGPALESRVSELFSEDPVRAMALDGAGVAALRRISESVVREIRAEAAAKGWGSGMRAQPGQEGWPIRQQRVIFDHVPAERIGVRLTDSALMIPQKSVSLVIGMGPDMRPDGVACDHCSKRDRCPWRIREQP